MRLPERGGMRYFAVAEDAIARVAKEAVEIAGA